jgi:formate C-acetyltransferase
MSDVIAALRDDFADASVRDRLLESPRWGNDDDRADRWALAWMQLRDGVRQEIEQEPGCRRHTSSHVVRSLHHIGGCRLGASPDGRPAHAPLCDSIGPPGGVSPEGPTALLNSVLKLNPAIHWPGGYNLNLTLSQRTALDPDLQANLIAMTDAFFADGGQELQISCLDAETLRDAKEHPKRYLNLLVRIAGFNALFVKLSPVEQDELIARAGS